MREYGNQIYSKPLKLAMSLIVFSLMAFATGGHAEEVGDAVFPEKTTLAGHELVLNGAGLREKWFVNVYASALYLSEPMMDPERIIKSDSPMAVRLVILSDMVDSEKLKEATMEGFEMATDGDMEKIRERVKGFLASFNEDVEVGDWFDIIYSPEKGVLVHKNGEDTKIIAHGMDFKEAVFGIWLSDDPVQPNLKEEMLGG